VTDKHVHRYGSTAEAPYTVVVSPEQAGWAYSGLRVLELDAGGSHELATEQDELIVLPLAGACTVEVDTGAGRTESFEVEGREDVFSRVTDFLYVPRDATVSVSSTAGGRFALPSARADQRLTARYGAAQDVPVELRGAGPASRQVNNFCSPATFPADKLMAVEVLTPGGNWSSYPPHKHDEERGGEVALEEIYYFEVDDTRARAATNLGGHPRGEAPRGVGYQRVYSSGPDREIDVHTEVSTGDVVLIPYGYHGPSMAAPGYDLYYLNVMAGPAQERAWRFCDDPAHAWVRGTWDDLALDPRLPLTSCDARPRS
jgi:5-deoxy-glucuronate isomerase